MPMNLADVHPTPFALHGAVGEAGRNVRIAILAEGFKTAAEKEEFRKAATRIKDTLISRRPFKSYLDRFVIVGIECESHESATKLKRNQPAPYVDKTPFDATFEYPGREPGVPHLERGLVCKRPVVRDVLGAVYPTVWFDAMLVLVNTTLDGGEADVTSRVACLSLNDPEDTFVHELGHVLGSLDDEYDYLHKSTEPTETYVGGEPSAPNLTLEKLPAKIKWGDLLSPIDDIPSTEPHPPGHCKRGHAAIKSDYEADGIVGLFEGGKHCACGVYRPSFECRMKTHAPFCMVCADVIRRTLVGGRIMAQSPIDTRATALRFTHMLDVVALYGREAVQGGFVAAYDAASGAIALLANWRILIPPLSGGKLVELSSLQTLDAGWMTMAAFGRGSDRFLLASRFDMPVRTIIKVTIQQNATDSAFQPVWSSSHDNDGPWTHILTFELNGIAHALHYNYFNGRVALDEMVDNMGVPEPNRLASHDWMPGWSVMTVLYRAGAPFIAAIHPLFGIVQLFEPLRAMQAGSVLKVHPPSKPGFLPLAPTHALGMNINGQPLLVTYSPVRSVTVHSLRLGGKPLLDFNDRRGLGFGPETLLGTGAPAMGAIGPYLWFYGAAAQEIRFLQLA